MSLSRGVSAPSLRLERQLLRQGYTHIAGLDEVGRGSWAGPVVAAAVVLPLHNRRAISRLSGVRDSKQLTPEERSCLAVTIAEVAVSIGIGSASHHVVDRDGLSFANRRALLRAAANLPLAPDALLIDFFKLPESDLPQVCIAKGDRRSLSIAAASIIAKTVRDRWMSRWEARYPGYGFASHKGYGTRAHRAAIAKLGLSQMHRTSYRLILEEEL
jgi:ribonuclease HII